MTYRVMIAGYAGMPATELSTHRWRWSAHFTCWLFNTMNPPRVFAFVDGDGR